MRVQKKYGYLSVSQTRFASPFAEVLKTAYINIHELACLILLIVIHINIKINYSLTDIRLFLHLSCNPRCSDLPDGLGLRLATLSVTHEVIKRARNISP